MNVQAFIKLKQDLSKHNVKYCGLRCKDSFVLFEEIQVFTVVHIIYFTQRHVFQKHDRRYPCALFAPRENHTSATSAQFAGMHILLVDMRFGAYRMKMSVYVW